jgi:hypothetical protein
MPLAISARERRAVGAMVATRPRDGESLHCRKDHDAGQIVVTAFIAEGLGRFAAPLPFRARESIWLRRWIEPD